jgi:hypothetical protein
MQMLPVAHVIAEGQSLSALHPQYFGPSKKEAQREPLRLCAHSAEVWHPHLSASCKQ